MYAVIETGGKQYRVAPGDILQVEKLTAEVGSAVTFDQVLFVSQPKDNSSQVWIGKPLVKNATVQGEIINHGRGEKLNLLRYFKRKGHKKRKGHRQEYTQLIITALSNGSGEQASLSDSDKKDKLGKFHSHLRPRNAKPKPKVKTKPSLKAADAPKKEAAPAKKPAKKTAAPKKKAAKKTTQKK